MTERDGTDEYSSEYRQNMIKNDDNVTEFRNPQTKQLNLVGFER